MKRKDIKSEIRKIFFYSLIIAQPGCEIIYGSTKSASVVTLLLFFFHVFLQTVHQVINTIHIILLHIFAIKNKIKTKFKSQLTECALLHRSCSQKHKRPDVFHSRKHIKSIKLNSISILGLLEQVLKTNSFAEIK